MNDISRAMVGILKTIRLSAICFNKLMKYTITS